MAGESYSRPGDNVLLVQGDLRPAGLLGWLQKRRTIEVAILLQNVQSVIGSLSSFEVRTSTGLMSFAEDITVELG